jgi:hypothetical protein
MGEKRKVQAISLVDVNNILATLNDRIPQYMSAIQTKMTQRIQACETPALVKVSKVKTVYSGNNKVREEVLMTHRPKFKEDYTEWAKLFFDYMRNKKQPPGITLRAGVEEVVEEAYVDATKEYFSSDEMCNLLRQGLAKQISNNSAIQDLILKEMKSTGKFFSKEFQDVMQTHAHTVAADRLHDGLVHIAHTAGGTALGNVLLHALSIPVVKMALVKAAGWAVASEACRLIVMKVGISVMAVAFLGSAAASSLLLWLAVPIIVGVITYQWIHLPETLAKEVPPKVIEGIRPQAKETNRKIVKSFVESSFDQIFDKIHEVAMQATDQ